MKKAAGTKKTKLERSIAVEIRWTSPGLAVSQEVLGFSETMTTDKGNTKRRMKVLVLWPILALQDYASAKYTYTIKIAITIQVGKKCDV